MRNGANGLFLIVAGRYLEDHKCPLELIGTRGWPSHSNYLMLFELTALAVGRLALASMKERY